MILRTINLLQPYRGQMQLFGQDVCHANKTLLRRRSALVFQETLLLNDTVFNNVAKVLEFRGIPANKIKQKVHTALATFGCEHLVNRSARSLSGGEAKRVCIACGLVADSELLLLDEPSASLDVGIRAQIIEKIRQSAEARGSAVILVSHNFTAIVDASIAAQNATLAAESLGLGTGYIGAIRKSTQEVSALLNLPPLVFPVFGLCVGYPNPELQTAIKPRLPQSAVLHRETYKLGEQDEAIAHYNDIIKNFYIEQKMNVAGDWSQHSAERIATLDYLKGCKYLREVLNSLGFKLL